MSSSMLIKSLTIHKDFMNPNMLKGAVTFVGVAGEVQINLDNERCSRIIGIVAEEVVATAKEVANLMTSQVLEQADQVKKLVTDPDLNF